MHSTPAETPERHIDLAEGERVVFERDNVVLTDRRLMANWSGGQARDVLTIADVDGVRRIEGGQESRLGAGLKTFAVGVILAAVQVPVDALLIDASSAPAVVNIFNTLLFVIWAVAIGGAGYLVITSLIRIKPHTSLLFVRFGQRDVRVSFPGRGSTDASKLRAAFETQRRATSL